MFNKEFIRDDGKIRGCYSNIAKMNILEYIIFIKFFRSDTYYTFIDCFDAIWQGIIGVCGLVMQILVLILSPIYFPILAHYRIKYAKEKVKNKL